MKKSAVVASILLMISIGFVLIVMVSCSNEILVYTVRFDSQGGNDIEPIEALKNSKLTEPSNPSRTGYEFGGWYKDSSYSERWVFSRDMVRSDMTLYAKWDAHTYAVTYNGNDQSTGTAPPTQSKKHGESLTLSTSSGTLERNGYRFGGWNTQSDGFGTNYESGTLYETDAEILLYAKWIAEEYNVTLNKQGGNSGSESITATYDSAMPSATAPIKNGYLFDGYYDQVDGGIQYYSSTMESSRIWNKADNTTLYAKWSPAYTVIFNSQEGSFVSSLEGVRQGSRIGEPAAPTRNGYAFDGWFKDSSCVAAWDFDVETINSNTTLYAKWVVAYTVEFDSQGGSNIVALEGIRQDSKITETPNPTRNGYSFEGWYKDSDCTIEWDFNVDIVDSDITLYAKWLVVLYTVNFNSQGGTDVGSVENILYGTKISEPVSPVKSKHVFGGWYRDSSYDQRYYFTTDMVTSSMTLYAKWFPPVTVMFDSQGGSSIPSISGIIYRDIIAEPTAPTKNGYVFGGWYSESYCLNQWNFGTDMVTSDMTLYAKWLALYTVYFDSLGGTAVSEITNIVHGTSISEPIIPTKSHHVFLGWYTDSACGSSYYFGDLVTSNMTLYACWQPLFVVTYESEGGSLVPKMLDIMPGNRISEPIRPTRSGYTFDGWYKDASWNDRWIFDSDRVKSDITLYAKWLPLLLVSFDSIGGSGVQALEIEYGRSIAEPIAPVKSGYTFGGWYKDSSCTIMFDFETEVVTSNLTLYAKWHPPYSVTFNIQDPSSLNPPSINVIYGQTYGDLPIPKREGYAFAGWWTGEKGQGEKIVPTSIVSICSDHDLYAYYRWMEEGYSVEGIGPAGGYVFYDKGSYSDGWRYLEAAPLDIMLGESDYNHIFGYYRIVPNGTSTLVGTAEGVGTGISNTSALVRSMGSSAYIHSHSSSLNTTNDYAARLCSIHEVGGYSDWFLPSFDELNLMYRNLKEQGVGGFYDYTYWSSSEGDSANDALVRYFRDGGYGYLFRATEKRIRPARVF